MLLSVEITVAMQAGETSVLTGHALLADDYSRQMRIHGDRTTSA